MVGNNLHQCHLFCLLKKGFSDPTWEIIKSDFLRMRFKYCIEISLPCDFYKNVSLWSMLWCNIPRDGIGRPLVEFLQMLSYHNRFQSLFLYNTYEVLSYTEWNWNGACFEWEYIKSSANESPPAKKSESKTLFVFRVSGWISFTSLAKLN